MHDLATRTPYPGQKTPKFVNFLELQMATVSKLRAMLQEQTLCLANLEELSTTKPIEISPYYNQLKQAVAERCGKWLTDDNARRQAIGCDLA